jgi:hypothetical protein
MLPGVMSDKKLSKKGKPKADCKTLTHPKSFLSLKTLENLM